MNPSHTIVPLREARGRAVFIAGSRLYVAQGYRILRSDDGGATWTVDCVVPSTGWKPIAARISLASRFLRFYIQAFQVLNDGTRVAVARDGIYRAAPGESRMERTWTLTRGSRPLNLSADGSTLLFGEYGGLDHVAVRLYRSGDSGKTFEVFHEFPQGDVHHIHGVVVDPFAKNYWVLAGDHGRTPGIAAIGKDGRDFEWIARGSQMVRAVWVLTRPDCLVYGSDSELEQNYIVRLEKSSGKYEKLMPIGGSSLYCADIGGRGFISTCVEPSAVNHGRTAALYCSGNDHDWRQVAEIRKDRWHNVAFQFGLIVLPYVREPAGQSPRGMFSGQALSGHHNKVSIFEINELTKQTQDDDV